MFLWSNRNGLHPFYAPDEGEGGTALTDLSMFDLGGLLNEVASRDSEEEDQEGQDQTPATPTPSKEQPPDDEGQQTPKQGEGAGEGDDSGKKEPAGKETPPAPKAPYTQEELIALKSEGRWHELDTSRLPEWALPIYESMNSVMSRSNQELVSARKEIQTALAEIRKTPRQQEVPQQPQLTREQQWKAIDDYIIKEVCAKELNIPVEDFDEFDRVHKLAYDAKYQELREAATAKQTKQVTMKQAHDEAANFVASLDQVHKDEPDYPEIMQFYPIWRRECMTVVQNEELDRRFQKVVLNKDTEGLESLYQELKKAMYQHKHGVAPPAGGSGQQHSKKMQEKTASPPSMMKPGGSTQPRKGAPITGEKLRKMDKYELGGLIEELGEEEAARQNNDEK